MPDAWETARGLDPNAAEDRNGDDNRNGYTNLEEYLNELAASGYPSGYPMTPIEWNGTPFDPPADPAEDPDPVAPLTGDVARSVTITDNSTTGADNAALWSVQPDLQVGDVTDGDRDYRFADIPGELLGSEWIRPAVESRAASNDDVVTLHVTRDTDVYVAYDSRIATPADWLTSQYQDTDTLITDDQPVPYRLYKRTVTAGTQLTMGPNSSGSTMNYIVILRPTTEKSTPATPTVPTGRLADGTASLQWDSVDDATGYIVYRSSIDDPYLRSIATTTDPRFTDRDLTAGMPYSYRVSAVQSGGESAQSDPLGLVYHDDSEEPPSTPGTPSASARSYSVEVSWPKVTDTVGYAIERVDGDGDFAIIGHSSKPTFTDTSAEPSTTYRYRVIALGAGGESNPSDPVKATTSGPLQMPTAPADPGVSNIGHSSVRLRWSPVTDAESYQVQRRADGGQSFEVIGSSDNTSYVDDTVDASVPGYRYRIVATNERGNSDPSTGVRVVTPLPAAPRGLVVGLKGESFVGLIFKPGSGFSTHAIYRREDGGEAERVGEAKVSSFYDRTTKPGHRYSYAVRAVNAAGESRPSRELTVRTYAAGLDGRVDPWQATTSYGSGALVSHHGHTWVARRDPGSTEPRNRRGPWMEAGEFVTGKLGPQRAWTSSWAYVDGDIVAYKGGWWQARRATRGRAPTAVHGPWRNVG